MVAVGRKRTEPSSEEDQGRGGGLLRPQFPDAAEDEVVVAGYPDVGDVAVDPGEGASQDGAARGRAAPPVAFESFRCLGAEVAAQSLLAGAQHVHAEGAT